MSTHRYIMIFKKPSRLHMSDLSRQHKYFTLKRHSANVRRRLINWLEKKDLINQVENIEEGTMFNVLFIDATEDVGRILSQFPDTVEVGEDSGMIVEAANAAP